LSHFLLDKTFDGGMNVQRLERLSLECAADPLGKEHGDGLHGYLGRPVKSSLLLSALSELSPMAGLLELECDSLDDDDLFTLLVQQVVWMMIHAV
jgi:hypothetical protein